MEVLSGPFLVNSLPNKGGEQPPSRLLNCRELNDIEEGSIAGDRANMLSDVWLGSGNTTWFGGPPVEYTGQSRCETV
jgi:hypothetical protein